MEIADGGDAIALNGEVGGKPGITGTVDDAGVANNDVVSGRRFLGGGRFERRVVSGGGDGAERLAGNGLGCFGVRRQMNVIDVSSESEALAGLGVHVTGETLAIEHHVGVELVFGTERAGLGVDV